MSPYVWFGLAMVAIVIVSLIVTGNLAAKFNERAKTDLSASLGPLAEIIDGSKDVDSASVEGRFDGQIVTARVVSGPGGMGRLFETTMSSPRVGSHGRPSSVVRSMRGQPGSAPSKEWTGCGRSLPRPCTNDSMRCCRIRAGSRSGTSPMLARYA